MIGSHMDQGASGQASDHSLSYDSAWRVLVGASLCMFCGQVAVVLYSFGVFVPEIIASTHWSGPAVAAAIGPGALVAAFVAPFLGMLSDRLGVRALAIVGGPLFALALVALGELPTSPAEFTSLMMLFWLVSFAGSPIPYAKLLTGWFDQRRGLAIGIMFAVGAVGISVWSLIAVKLIAWFGWRHAYAIMGMVSGSVMLLSGLLFLRDAPIDPARAARSTQPTGTSLSEAVRLARFWKIVITFALLTAALAGTAVNFPVILRQLGADAQQAASVMAIIGITMLLGRLSLAFLLDRTFSPYLTIAITAVPMVGLGLLALGTGKAALFVAAATVGFGLGSEFAAAAYMVSRAFGLRAFGTIYGVVTLAASLGTAVGPAAIGISLKEGVSIRTILGCLLAVLILTVLVLSSFRRQELPFGGADKRSSPTAALTDVQVRDA